MKCVSLRISSISQIWITPVVRQTFVTTGVSLNMSGLGTVLAFAASLLEQLKEPGSDIPINDEDASWILSIHGLFIFAGTIFATLLMAKYGRRPASLISVVFAIVGWTGMIFAPNFAVILISRSIYGINIGMMNTLGSLLIGEYASPTYRGAFLVSTGIYIGVGSWLAHILGAYITWRMEALAFTIISIINFVVVYLSPESPTWLATQGRFEECKTVFRWLRGDSEEEELDKLIKTCTLKHNKTEESCEEAPDSFFTKAKHKLMYLKATGAKKEFYKPLIIMAHVYVFPCWNGIIVLLSYPSYFIKTITDTEVNIPLVIMGLDIHRIVAGILATYIIRKLRRRTMLVVTISINIAALMATAAYMYAKQNYGIHFESPLIWIVFMHSIMFSIATGSSLIPYVIAGEILPLEHKNLAGGIITLIFSLHIFVICKTVPLFFTNVGIHGTFVIYSVIMSYCLIVAWFMLPETKDKTLQDIEEELRGKPRGETLDPNRMQDV